VVAGSVHWVWVAHSRQGVLTHEMLQDLQAVFSDRCQNFEAPLGHATDHAIGCIG